MDEQTRDISLNHWPSWSNRSSSWSRWSDLKSDWTTWSNLLSDLSNSEETLRRCRGEVHCAVLHECNEDNKCVIIWWAILLIVIGVLIFIAGEFTAWFYCFCPCCAIQACISYLTDNVSD
jgi:hypothetical protein